MVKVSCKSCRTMIEVRDDEENCTCKNCGINWRVNRKGGGVVLQTVSPSDADTGASDKKKKLKARMLKMKKSFGGGGDDEGEDLSNWSPGL